MLCYSMLNNVITKFVLTSLIQLEVCRSDKLWASLVAQLVKNPPAKQETPVQFLGHEDHPEKG